MSHAIGDGFSEHMHAAPTLYATVGEIPLCTARRSYFAVPIENTPLRAPGAQAPPVKHAHILRVDDMEQLSAGWIDPPLFLIKGGSAEGPLYDFNIVFRIGLPPGG